MDIMGHRNRELQEALAGYQQTGIPLVAYDGTRLKAAGFTDDPGIYYFVPQIAQGFNISIDQATDIFFLAWVGLSLALGMAGALFYFKTRIGRWAGCAALLLLALFTWQRGDVYVVSPSLCAALIPWVLYFCERGRDDFKVRFLVFFSGLAIGASHFLRSHSGTAVFIFASLLILFYLSVSWKKKSVLLACLVVGLLLPRVYFHHLLEQRNAFLLENVPQYENAEDAHPFWHSVYIGFGFLSNDLGIEYADESARGKVRALSPRTPLGSPEAERILKSEVFRLVREHPAFVAYTLFAKLGVVLLYLLLFANIGLPAAALFPKHRVVELAFWSGMIFNAGFGILVVPGSRYLLGFVAFSVLYAVASIDEAIHQGAVRFLASGWRLGIKKT